MLGYSITGITSSSGSGTLVQQPGGVAFRYLGSQDRHELMIPGRDWGVLGAPSTLGSYPFSFQRVTIGTGASAFTYDLNLFLLGEKNALLPLAYTSYGSWAASAISPLDSTKTDQNYGAFAYGVPTAESGVPRTGIGRFEGYVFDGYDTPGDVVVTIDFATGQVTGSIKPSFNDGLGGIGSPGAIPFTGSIQPGASAFEVSFPVGSTGRTGLLEVQLTGPAAEELMLRWSATIVVPHFSAEAAAYILPGVARRG